VVRVAAGGQPGRVRANVVAGVVLAVLAVAGPGAGSAGAVGSAAGAGSAAPVAAVTAEYRLPLVGPAVVLTPFRPPPQPWLAGHRGVDLAATVGDPVLAAGPGVVVFAGPLAGRGVVSVEHSGGLRTTYEPVTAAVSRGQAVGVGDVLGVVEAGHPSCAPASCLHWGARLGETYVDPMLLLGPVRVRLLPWDEP
jgi:murein DD-endopeptidase MepM/ murein hydrolase activator NlpD